MSRKIVVEVACDRCSRVEYRKMDEAETTTEQVATLTLSLAAQGKTGLLAEFGELCGPCYHTVLQHAEAIAKKIEGLSPDRKARKEEP